jgi:hypothetical protein
LLEKLRAWHGTRMYRTVLTRTRSVAVK